MHVSQGQQRSLCRSQRPDHICSSAVVGPLNTSAAFDRRRQHIGVQCEGNRAVWRTRTRRRRDKQPVSVVQRKREAMDVRQLTNAVGEHLRQTVLRHCSTQPVEHVRQAPLKGRLLSKEPLGVVGGLGVNPITVGHVARRHQRAHHNRHHAQKDAEPQTHGLKLTTKCAKKKMKQPLAVQGL